MLNKTLKEYSQKVYTNLPPNPLTQNASVDIMKKVYITMMSKKCTFYVPNYAVNEKPRAILNLQLVSATCQWLIALLFHISEIRYHDLILLTLVSSNVWKWNLLPPNALSRTPQNHFSFFFFFISSLKLRSGRKLLKFSVLLTLKQKNWLKWLFLLFLFISYKNFPFRLFFCLGTLNYCHILKDNHSDNSIKKNCTVFPS